VVVSPHTLQQFVTYAVERHLSRLTEMARYPDMQKILIIGFFFENRLHWKFYVEKFSTNG
jgi:hypothetical protein